MNCSGCGAPLRLNDEVCEYCGKVTPYAESRIREHKEPHIHTLKPSTTQRRLRYVPVWETIAIYILTIGSYSQYWYFAHWKQINSLQSDEKLPAWGVYLYVFTLAAFIAMPRGCNDIAPLIVIPMFITSMCLAIHTGDIFRQHAANFIGTDKADRMIAPSYLLLVLAGPIYLQYCVNKMIKMNIL